MSLSQVDIEKVKHLHSIDSTTSYLFSHMEATPRLKQALEYSKKAHISQTRKSGEPYIIHPILVASIVASITDDEAMAIAALLHDVVEDTDITIEEISKLFGEDVAHLVEGLTKIDIIRDSELVPSASNEKLIVSALSFRKMLLASVKDVRVLVIKLCDRLHNMLTLDALPEHKQLRIAEETLVVYAPIAHRLGISFLKNILEDLSFGYLFKEEKHHIDNYLDTNYHAMEMKLNDLKESITRLLSKNGFCEDDFEIISRVKHRYSIYLKMQRKGVSIDEVLDLLAIRILTTDSVRCYNILGLIHLNFQPLSSRFKDYIAVAKDNGYQTIHTTVFHNTAIFEVQIRTYDMHKTAELGVAAHWKYKSGGNNDIKLDWLHNLQYQSESVEDFYELIKNDLYSEDISVFSPKGDAFTLPRGAVALDFAYAVHSEVGNKADTCLINKTKSSLLSELSNGDIVKVNTKDEIITRCSWIDAVKTSKATSNMRLNCNARIREINAKSSILIVSTVMGLKASRIEDWFEINDCDGVNIPCDIEHFRTVIGKYTKDIGKNNRFTNFLSRHKFKLKSKKTSGLEIFSTRNISDVVFDYCCHPKSGDEVMAFLEKTKVHVHHKMCGHAYKKLENNEPMVFIRWEKKNKHKYNLIGSMHNEKGALAEFLTYLVKLNIDISSIELGKDTADYVKYCELGFESDEADINALRAKISSKIKIIHFIRTDDAYR